jgi:multidrug efflux pump subunit AcrA (membrane-fusion protein)
MELVFVVSEGRARLRIVKTGRRIGDDVELVSGVEAGESLVVENPSGLVDGQPLRVR